MIKPHKAENWNREKQRFPVMVMPKIDGVRGMYINDNGIRGRSGKPHANRHITHLFSMSHFGGLDGELIAQRATHPDLCRLTTSAVRSVDGTPLVRWQVFDFVRPSTYTLPYIDRYALLTQHVERIKGNGAAGSDRIDVVPYVMCHDMDHLDHVHDHNVQAGFEGSILRDPAGKYKQGRSTVNDGAYLRIKDFVFETAVVVGITEGRKNNNVATEDDYGHTERATLAENMEPNGMVGSMQVKFLREVVYDDRVVFNTTDVYTVAAGRMDHKDRAYYFQHPERIIGAYIEAQVFLHGTKDRPRFPTFQHFRANSDVESEQ